MMTPSKFLSNACPQTREAALDEVTQADFDIARAERNPRFRYGLMRVVGIQIAVGSHTRNSIAEEYAALNLMNQTPAYGWKCGQSDAAAAMLAQAINRFSSIDEARADYAAYFARQGRDVMAVSYLDNLLPLNSEAATELAKAYGDAGTFRLSSELLDRVEKYEAKALSGSLGSYGKRVA